MFKFLIAGFLILAMPFVAASQSVGPLVMYAGQEAATPVLSERGKELFRLPAGHLPVLESQYTHASYGDRANIFPYADGFMVVQRPDKSFYWIDEQGHIIRELGNTYSKMYAAVNGLVLAHVPIPDKHASWLVFLNKEGKNAFGQRKFWEATPFSEGLALVQLEHEKGPWGYIDASGEIVVRPALEQVLRLGSFHHGRAKALVRRAGQPYAYGYYFIDTLGKAVIDVQAVVGDRKISRLDEFSSGLAAVYVSRPRDKFFDVLYIDTAGSIVHQLESVESTSGFVSGVAAVNLGIPLDRTSFRTESFLLSVDGSRTTVQLPDSLKLFSLYRFDHAALQPGQDTQWFLATLANEERLYKGLIDSQGKLHYVSAHDVWWVGYGLLAERLNKMNFRLLNLEGKILWQTPVSERLFTSLKEALPHRNELLWYRSNKLTDLEKGLFKLRNLQKLEIAYVSLPAFPEGINRLSNLQELRLNSLQHLQSLPEDLIKLRKLHTLVIQGCKDLKGLEAFIEQMPALRYVEISDYQLSPGFEAKMKTINPDLIIKVEEALDIEIDMWVEEVVFDEQD